MAAEMPVSASVLVDIVGNALSERKHSRKTKHVLQPEKKPEKHCLLYLYLCSIALICGL